MNDDWQEKRAGADEAPAALGGREWWGKRREQEQAIVPLIKEEESFLILLQAKRRKWVLQWEIWACETKNILKEKPNFIERIFLNNNLAPDA